MIWLEAVGARIAPANFGPMRGCSTHAEIEGSCGDTMAFWARLEDVTVLKATFTTDGCETSRSGVEREPPGPSGPSSKGSCRVMVHPSDDRGGFGPPPPGFDPRAPSEPGPDPHPALLRGRCPRGGPAGFGLWGGSGGSGGGGMEDRQATVGGRPWDLPGPDGDLRPDQPASLPATRLKPTKHIPCAS